MNIASNKAFQDHKKLSNLDSNYRTKLHPRKKTKDTQNYELAASIHDGNENTSELDLPEMFEYNLSGSENSKKDASFSRISKSAVQITSLNRNNNEECGKMLNDSFNTLPSKMWWVSPLKAPSNYLPPSITMSSKSYSKISTVAKPRVIRSAEDLRKKVIYQCNLLESVGYDKIHKRSEKIEDDKMAPIGDISLNELPWVPSITIPSTNQTQSKQSIDLDTHKSEKSLIKRQFVQNLTKFPSSQIDLGISVFNQIAKQSETCTNGSSSHGKLIFSKGVDQSTSNKLFSNKSSQYEKMNIDSDMNQSITIGDIARKHIVNPLTAKLARLCTKQGQLYLDVINDLEKSCGEFEKACKHGVMKK